MPSLNLTLQKSRPSKISEFFCAGKFSNWHFCAEEWAYDAIKICKISMNFVKLCQNHKKMRFFPVLHSKVKQIAQILQKKMQPCDLKTSALRSSAKSMFQNNNWFSWNWKMCLKRHKILYIKKQPNLENLKYGTTG